MATESLFNLLNSANTKPPVFSKYTARALWTDEHTSAKMLSYHLNEDIDVSSRRGQFIDASIRWMIKHFKLCEHNRVVDFGCGPGLYTSRLAQTGAQVVGIDFSSRSIEYARRYAKQHNLDITYLEADYLTFQPHGAYDLISMIMCDFCALSPDQRAKMLSKFARLLAEDGRILLDVYSMEAFAKKEESSHYEKNQLNGLWSSEPYYAFVSSFKYATEKVSLDKYTVVKQQESHEIYNWLQYFTPETLEQEANQYGLTIEQTYADVTGHSYQPESNEFAVVMKKSR